MISLDDIVGMTDLTKEEIGAIAEHEHLSEAGAAALADYMMHQPKGPAAIRGMISDDIREALNRGDKAHAKELVAALRHFVHEHPEAAS